MAVLLPEALIAQTSGQGCNGRLGQINIVLSCLDRILEQRSDQLRYRAFASVEEVVLQFEKCPSCPKRWTINNLVLWVLQSSIHVLNSIKP